MLTEYLFQSCLVHYKGFAMKKLLVLIYLLTLPALAQIPEYLKDGEVTVTLKDGSVHKLSSNDFKLVPRTKPKPKSIAKTTAQSVQQTKSNRLIVHAGVGKDGLKVNSSNNYAQIEEKRKSIAGLTYCRGIEVGLCASAFTNETFTLGIGLGF